MKGSNQDGNPYDQQQGSRGPENRDVPANHLAKSLDDLDRIKKTIDPEENKKKDPVPESMKPDQGSKTIMKLVAMALLIIGAVALGPGIGAAILGTLAGGAGLLAANDILGASGNAPLQSKKSKRKDQQTDKMHEVEQKALDAALESVKKNIEQINAPTMVRPVPLAESKVIPAGSGIYSPSEIDEMVRKGAAEAMMEQKPLDRQLVLGGSPRDSQNPSNSGQASPNINRKDLTEIIRSEVQEALQGVVAAISKDREERGSGERGGGERGGEGLRVAEREGGSSQARESYRGAQETIATRSSDSERRSVYQGQPKLSQGAPAAARSPSGRGGRVG